MVLAHNINEGQRTQDIRINQDITFDTMLLTSNTLRGLKESGFYKPSPIQLHGIPLGKCGFDLLLEAKSGTGKTAVFTVIALEKIHLNKGLQVIILAPTREIAMQIYDVIKQIGARHKGLCIEVVMGGLSLKDDIEKFKKNVHIVVGSPGRLKHLIQDKYINTTAVRLLIFDEADKLMEKSFQNDISYIHLALPKQKQVIMSSATYPDSSKSFIKYYVQNAQHICPDSNNVLLGIEQKVILVKYNCNIVRQTQHRFSELLKILSNKQFKQCLIFCNYQARVSEIHKMLNKVKWPAEQLYGQQEQTHRLDALKILQEYKCRLLISTDLAARGIDASNVDLVINFEPPFEWQTYLHRIGRAGRFGSYGIAITILSEGAEEKKFKTLLESIKHPFQLTDLWTNAHFSINVDNNKSINNQCLTSELDNHGLDKENMPHCSAKENYEKLWNILTDDMKKSELESFDNLFKSFMEPESSDKIELFSDLILSFGTSKNNVMCDNNEFPQLDLLELPYKDSNIQKSKSSKNINNGLPHIQVNERCKNDKLGTLRINNDILEKPATVSSELDFISKGNHDHISENHLMKSTNHINRHQSEIEINNNTKNVTDNLESDSGLVLNCNGHGSEASYGINLNAAMHKTNLKIESKNMCQTLADFGLPSSFSSSKQLKSQNKLVPDPNKAKREIDKYDGKHVKVMSSSQIHSKTTIVNDQLNKKNSKQKVFEHSYKQHEYGQQQHLAQPESFPGYKHSHEINGVTEMPSTSKYVRGPNMAKEYHNYSNLCKIQKPNIFQQYCSNQKYINWYNLLKFQMKQLELTMYLNEINKL